MAHPADVDERLCKHLESWLGAWPPQAAVHVVGSDKRSMAGWDGAVAPFLGVETPHGAVVSVPPTIADAVGQQRDLDEIAATVADLFGRPGAVLGRGVFRWSTAPTSMEERGVWVPTDDPRIPAWLRPFNGDVLVSLDRDTVTAGVGRKQHDVFGHELAVVTEEEHRGEGLALSLVTQAARRVLADGAVPTYLHGESNTASARTARAAGFDDVGWKVLGLYGPARD